MTPRAVGYRSVSSSRCRTAPRGYRCSSVGCVPSRVATG
jgi:hypothetical protein